MADRQKTDAMKLDEFLAEQGAGVITATLEPIPNRPDHIKLTPWRGGLGCLCQYSIEIPKTAIRSVRPTGDLHDCCGKLLRVVEVMFNPNASLTLDEVMGQMMKNMTTHSEAHQPHPTEAGAQLHWAPADPNDPSMTSAMTDFGAPSPARRPCQIGQLPCRGSCGERCYNPGNSHCFGGLVCPWGWHRCGRLCKCYNPTNSQCYGDIICPRGWQRCHGRCGTRCVNPSNSHCYSGLVCPWGWLPCGCRCYNPATQTCQRGMVMNSLAYTHGSDAGWDDAQESWA